MSPSTITLSHPSASAAASTASSASRFEWMSDRTAVLIGIDYRRCGGGTLRYVPRALAGEDPAAVRIGAKFHETADDLGVELRSAGPSDLLERLLERQRPPVGAIRSHGVEGVHEGEDAGAERDVLAAQPARI